eukprot:5320223-Prorocentrum_lima.AAC.1
MAVPMDQTAVPPIDTPLNTDWQYTQYPLPSATSASHVYTPASATTWPGVMPPAHSPVSDQ